MIKQGTTHNGFGVLGAPGHARSLRPGVSCFLTDNVLLKAIRRLCLVCLSGMATA